MHLLRGALDGSVETAKLNGREYLIVPVVAMVEGVLHAANADAPELVPVSAFGRIPDSWNGRPVVVDHPANADGVAISASQPSVLSEVYLGQMMNAVVDGSKLRVEAWIDLTGAAASDVTTKMLARIANEEVIEVSVGAYVMTRAEKGEFQGKSYSAVWEMCIPDHLAFLSTAEGACSIADGCGTFRTDAARSLAFSVNARKVLAPIKEKSMACKCQQHDAPDTTASTTEATDHSAVSEETPAPRAASSEGLVERFCLANGLTANDARSLISNAMSRWDGYAYLISFSDDVVYYEGYESGRYGFYRRSYSIASDNVVTFEDDVVEVIPMTRFVEVPHVETAAAGDKEEGEEDVADEQNVVTVARDASVEQALQAFEGTTFGRALQSALSVESGIRTDLVTKILAAKGNTLTEDALKALPTEALKGMAALADASAAQPAAQKDTQPAPTQHGRSGGAGSSNRAPEPPKVFSAEYLDASRQRMRA